MPEVIWWQGPAELFELVTGFYSQIDIPKYFRQKAIKRLGFWRGYIDRNGCRLARFGQREVHSILEEWRIWSVDIGDTLFRVLKSNRAHSLVDVCEIAQIPSRCACA